MGSERFEPPPGRSQDGPVCPACGKPVGTVVRRHKTLGAYVPVWGPGPCTDPECARADPAPPEEAEASGPDTAVPTEN